MLLSGSKLGRIARAACNASAGYGHMSVLCFSLLIFQPPAAHAADAMTIMGVGGGGNTIYAYSGRIKAMADTMDGTGAVIRLWAKTYKFNYRTNLTPASSTKIRTIGTGALLELGYQWKNDFVRLAGFAGLDFRVHSLRPNDPRSRLKDKLSPNLALNGTFKLSETLGLDANASTSILYRETWVQARPYYRFPTGLKIGPDLAIIGGKDYTFSNVGLYGSGIKLNIPIFGTVYLGVKAGVQHDKDKGHYGPYGGFHIAFFM